jgi:hypothetical protein
VVLLGIDSGMESLIKVRDIYWSILKLAIMLVISEIQLNWSSEERIIYLSLFLEKIFLVNVDNGFLLF